MPFIEQAIIVNSIENRKGTIKICEVLWGISITGKLEVLMREVARIIQIEAYQVKEANTMPRQGGVSRRERPEQSPGPEEASCYEAEATAKDGLLRPQGVRLLFGGHLQVRG